MSLGKKITLAVLDAMLAILVVLLLLLALMGLANMAQAQTSTHATNGTFSNSLTVNGLGTSSTSYNNVVEADTQVGADIGAKINNAFAALSATGGIIEASGLSGPQSCTTNITLGGATKPATLRVPQGAQWSGSCQVTIAGSGSGIIGSSGTQLFDFDQIAAAQWTYTGSGNHITISPGIRGVFLRDLTFAGSGGGASNGLYATGNDLTSTSVTGLNLQNVVFKGYGQDGIHFEDAVYNVKFYRVAGISNGRYGFFQGPGAASRVGFTQAEAYSSNFCANAGPAQVHIEQPSGGTHDFTWIGGTICDTPVQAAGNGIEVAGGSGVGSRAEISGVHFESIGGTTVAGTPDLVNAPIYVNVGIGFLNIRNNFFVVSSGYANKHNAIVLDSGAVGIRIALGPGNHPNNYTALLDASTPAPNGNAQIATFDASVLASSYVTGNFPFQWMGGQFTKEDGTNFRVVNSANVTQATINNATGKGTFNGGVQSNPLTSASTNPAASGFTRAASTDQYCWRNNGNSADICISKNSSDVIQQPATNFTGTVTQGGIPLAGGFTCVNVTPVTVNTNTASDQNLMACTIPAGTLNGLGKTLLIQLAGIYSTPAASSTTVNLKAKLCTVSGCGSGTVVTLASLTSAALGAIQATNDPFNVTLNSSTQTAGASASFEAHGNLTIDISALTSAAEGVYADGNTATVGTIDSTAQLFLQITGAFSSASASNSMSLRQLIADSVD